MITDESRGATTIELPGCRRIIERKDAIKYVFPPPIIPEMISKRAILAGTNEEVDQWNEHLMTSSQKVTILTISYEIC